MPIPVVDSIPQVSRQMQVGPADPARMQLQVSSEKENASWTCYPLSRWSVYHLLRDSC